MKIAVSVTTFKKTTSLRVWLDSLVNFGQVDYLSICDDNDGECQNIAEEYSNRWEQEGRNIKVSYLTGPRKGVAPNKNRGIKHFLEHTDADYLIASDDDLNFRINTYRYGEPYFLNWLMKAHEGTGLPHILTNISWGLDPLSGLPLLKQFPPHGEDEWCYYIGGAQGVVLSFARKAVEAAGYMDVMPTTYGFEHILYSARINRLFGRCPVVFPLLKYCDMYFACNNIPNNYTINPEDIKKNDRYYQKRMEDVINGVGLKVSRWE